MHPAFLDNMSWEMAEVYGAISDQIMINLARHFPYYEYVSDVPTSAFAYQAKMLAQMGQVNKETVRIIRNGLENADLALQGVLEQAIIDAVKSAEPELLEGVKKGIFMMPQTPVLAPNQMRAFKLYYEQAANKLNLVNTVMLESTQSAYQQMVSDVVNEFELVERINRTQIALDTAAGETITGVSSWNQALKHATDRLKEGGITGFIDHAGRQWSAEAYVAMDVRTTVFNTGRAAVWETNKDFGNDLYLVSYHNGARPLCYPWQNKVISATNNARTVQDLDGNNIQVIAQSDTSYGEAAGLFGINCKHYPTPFIPGVSLADGKPQDPAENEKTYKESQEQRRLERKIREEKRDLQMMKAQGAPEDAIAKQREKVKQSSADIDDFCRETGRARHRDREAVYTKREFPDADRYDVSQFKKDQQKIINDYYRKGGEQQGFQFFNVDPETGERKTLTPNVPLEPKKLPTIPAPDVEPEPEVMTYGKAFEYEGNRKAQKEQFASAKETLSKAPDSIKKAWSGAADNLDTPIVGSDSNAAYYSRYEKRVHFKTYKVGFDESEYQRKNTVFFHEYGHNIDNFYGGYTINANDYLSVKFKDNAFGKMIEQECDDAVKQFFLKKNGYKDAYDAVKAAQNSTGGMGFESFTRQMLKSVMPADEFRAIRTVLTNADDSVLRPLVDKWLPKQFETELKTLYQDRDVGKSFTKWVKETYDIYQRADVSDMFERYTVKTFGIQYPFGVGHGTSYALDEGATPKEAFAEMFSATVTGNDSLGVIQTFFPKSYNIFIEMIESVIKND